VGALFPIVVADLTRGSGHFAAAQGVVGTAHQTGAMASMALGGALAAWGGYDTAFVALAAVAALGAVLFWLAMPETRGAPAVAVSGHAEAKTTA
jgi:predicted MFS family arabinose efflux permease